MLHTLSRLALRRRRAVLVVAALLAMAGAATVPTLFGKLSAGGFEAPGAESSLAAETLEDAFGHVPNLTMLVSAPDGVDDPAATTSGVALTRQLAAEPGVEEVVSYWTAGSAPQLRSTDGDQALVMASITGDENAVNERVGELADRYRGAHDGLSVDVGGYAMLTRELTEQSERDVILGEMIVLPMTLIGLVFVFGSVVAAALPLVVAVVTSLLAMGVLWMLASVIELSVFAGNTVTLLGLGLAIDYSLLMVKRYREELRTRESVGPAVRATMLTAGRTVAFSAVTVAIALASMAWVPLPAVQSMAYAGVATALLAAVAALTVLPALLVIFGSRLDRGSLAGGGAAHGAQTERAFWHRLAMLVMRRPIPIATVVIAFLLTLGTPFLGIELGYVDERVLPESSHARQVATAIRSDFDSGEQDALQVVGRDGPVDTVAVGTYAAELSGLPHVARVDSSAGSYADGALLVPAGPQHERFASGDGEYLSVVPEPGLPELVEDLARDVRAVPAPFDTMVGGSAAVSIDANDALIDSLPAALGTLAAAMVLLLFLLTGSVVLPFLALVLSALSLTATFGALVWVFQDGHLSGIFGDVATGSIISTVPVMLFAVAFGLAMDYQVFMFARIREEYDRSRDPAGAVAMGLERIGSIVTAAAVLISMVFLAFLISDVSLMKAFGLGLPLAVLLDATLIRGALLPATMKLTGAAAWWAPERLRRIYRRFGLHEAGDVAPGTRVMGELVGSQSAP